MPEADGRAGQQSRCPGDGCKGCPNVCLPASAVPPPRWRCIGATARAPPAGPRMGGVLEAPGRAPLLTHQQLQGTPVTRRSPSPAPTSAGPPATCSRRSPRSSLHSSAFIIMPLPLIKIPWFTPKGVLSLPSLVCTSLK